MFPYLVVCGARTERQRDKAQSEAPLFGLDAVGSPPPVHEYPFLALKC